MVNNWAIACKYFPLDNKLRRWTSDLLSNNPIVINRAFIAWNRIHSLLLGWKRLHFYYGRAPEFHRCHHLYYHSLLGINRYRERWKFSSFVWKQNIFPAGLGGGRGIIDITWPADVSGLENPASLRRIIKNLQWECVYHLTRQIVCQTLSQQVIDLIYRNIDYLSSCSFHHLCME